MGLYCNDRGQPVADWTINRVGNLSHLRALPWQMSSPEADKVYNPPARTNLG